MSFLVTTTPTDTKTNRSPGHGRHVAVCHISPSYDTAFWRSFETEKINKHSNIVQDYFGIIPKWKVEWQGIRITDSYYLQLSQ